MQHGEVVHGCVGISRAEDKSDLVDTWADTAGIHQLIKARSYTDHLD